MKTTYSRGGQFLAILLLSFTTPLLFGSTLINRYEFNGNTLDSVGKFNGNATTATKTTEAPLFAANVPSGATGPTQSIQFGMNNKSGGLKSGFNINPAAVKDLASGTVSFFFQVNDSNTDQGYAFALIGSSANLATFTPADSVEMRAGSAGVIATSLKLKAKTWNHLALTWHDTDAGLVVTYYINGSKLGTVTRPGNLSENTSLRIGSFNLGDNTDNVVNQFIGRMYDLQFYEGALTGTQVKTLAKAPGTVIP